MAIISLLTGHFIIAIKRNYRVEKCHIRGLSATTIDILAPATMTRQANGLYRKAPLLTA